MNIKTRRKLFYFSTLFFLLIAPPLLLYTTGWRLTSDFQIKRTGGMFVAVPEAGSSVYLNGKFIKNTNFLQSGVFIQNLTPETHAIMIQKEGFWPWTKKLLVSESSVAESRSFMLPQNIEGKILLKGEFETMHASDKNPVILLEEQKNGLYSLTFYIPSSNEFLTPANSASKKLISGNKKLKTVSWHDEGAEIFFENNTISLTFDFSKRVVYASVGQKESDDNLSVASNQISMDWRKKAELWHEDKDVWVKWITTPLPYFLSSSTEAVFHARSPIRSTSFFPKRNDLAIIAYENGVFAVELDGRGNRNIQPIYKGKEPSFVILNNEIFVLDQKVLAKMEL